MKKFLAVIAVLSLIAFMGFGCGEKPGTTEEPTDAETPEAAPTPETPETPELLEEYLTIDPDSVVITEITEISGAWTTSTEEVPEAVITFTFLDDGTYEMKLEIPGEEMEPEAIKHKYEVVGNTINFTDIEELGCEDIVGEYEYQIEGSTLTFTSVVDECAERKEALAPLVLERKE